MPHTQKRDSKVVPITNKGSITLGELEVGRGCSLEFSHSSNNRNGIPKLIITPHYDKNNENQYKTREPRGKSKEKLRLLKNSVEVADVEGFTTTINNMLHGGKSSIYMVSQTSPYRVILRKHVAYKDNKARSVFYYIVGIKDDDKKSGFRININTVALQKIALLMSKACEIRSVFPVQSIIGEGSSATEASSTLLINNGSMRVICSDERVNNTIFINEMTKEIIKFMSKMTILKSQSLAIPVLVRGHTVENNSVSFITNNVRVKLQIPQRVCQILAQDK